METDIKFHGRKTGGQKMTKIWKNVYEDKFGPMCIGWQNLISNVAEKYMIVEQGNNRRYRYVTPDDIISLMEKRIKGDTSGMRGKFVKRWKRTLDIAKRIKESDDEGV
jgi:hypothetical protein